MKQMFPEQEPKRGPRGSPRGVAAHCGISEAGGCARMGTGEAICLGLGSRSVLGIKLEIRVKVRVRVRSELGVRIGVKGN